MYSTFAISLVGLFSFVIVIEAGFDIGGGIWIRSRQSDRASALGRRVDCNGVMGAKAFRLTVTSVSRQAATTMQGKWKADNDVFPHHRK